MQLITTEITGLSDYTQQASQSPEVTAETYRMFNDINAAIELLAPRTAAMVRKHYYEELTYKQIGKTFQISAGRAQQIVKRAFRELGRSLVAYRPVFYDDLYKKWEEEYGK